MNVKALILEFGGGVRGRFFFNEVATKKRLAYQ